MYKKREMIETQNQKIKSKTGYRRDEGVDGWIGWAEEEEDSTMYNRIKFFNA